MLGWVLIIGGISIVWAIVSFLRERDRKEVDEVSEEMTKGKVIFHASSSSGVESDSSS